LLKCNENELVIKELNSPEVLLIYCQPDEVERQPSNHGQKSYQIWY